MSRSIANTVTVTRRRAPCDTAQAMASRISSAAEEFGKSASDVLVRRVKWTAEKRESSQIVGSQGGGVPLSSWGKMLDNKYGPSVGNRRAHPEISPSSSSATT